LQEKLEKESAADRQELKKLKERYNIVVLAKNSESISKIVSGKEIGVIEANVKKDSERR
jgi:hypothetical protein